MNKQDIEISVLVVTYNADWNKTKQTLYSILMQKNVNYEIVIVDDGSVENNFEKINEYFEEYNFEKYTLVPNKTNLGTVKNMLSGLQVCKGEYVKDISPGDFLYDENTLYKILQEINQEKKELYFGKAIYYGCNEGQIEFYNISHPHNLEVYKNPNQKKITKNYLLKHDYILGASLIVKTDVYLEFLKRIEHCVVYAEDCSFIYMVAEGIVPVFINRDVIWYEYGSGISTSQETVWGKRLFDDNKNTFSLLIKENKIPKIYYEMFFSEYKIMRLLLSCFFNPSIIVNKVIRYKKMKQIPRNDSKN